MWKSFWASGGHYIIGLAGIGATSALMAVGVVTAGAGMPIISAVVGALIGVGGVHLASTTTTTTKPPGS